MKQKQKKPNGGGTDFPVNCTSHPPCLQLYKFCFVYPPPQKIFLKKNAKYTVPERSISIATGGGGQASVRTSGSCQPTPSRQICGCSILVVMVLVRDWWGGGGRKIGKFKKKNKKKTGGGGKGGKFFEQ